MKLINKMSIWFMVIYLLVTPISVIILYHSVRDKIDHTQIARMKKMNDGVASLIQQNKLTNDYTVGKPIQIEKLNSPLPAQQTQVFNGSHGEKDMDKNGYLITVTSFYKMNDVVYKVSSYNYTTNSTQIFLSMLSGVVAKLLLVGFALILLTRYFSKKIFQPFRDSMHALDNFDLKQRKEITLPETNIKEFQRLNCFIKKMTNKVIKDYNKAKEFSENASHELQTPLAVVRSKMELLAETNIDAQQADLIADMQNAIEKLSCINRSLVLLSKLENQEFKQEEIKFCRVTRNVLSMYEDWIALRDIEVTTKFDSNIYLNIHPTLAEILIANLISNAIRHNVVGGKLEIVLTKQTLRVSNTGNAIDISPKELFLRFKKGNQSSDGTGLGLAIVKQICEENDFKIRYDYQNHLHHFNLCFDKNVYEKEDASPVLEKEFA